MTTNPTLSTVCTTLRHDPLVSFGGCCNNKVSHGSGRCCCGIDEHSGNECIDVEAGFDQWATHVNACGQDEVLSYTGP
jgi:hypothetical protein